MYYLKKSSIFLISIPVLTTIMLLGYFCTPKTEAATDCCYHECNMTEPNKCEGNNVMACTLGPGCDGDNYNDWCLLQDCSLTGQMCAGGVCGGVSPSPTCADNTPYNQCSVNTGKPWYCNNSGNLIENCGLCGCAGTWVCGPAFRFCCDGACNNTCSNINCSIAKDPDCGVGGCCGDGTCNAAETNATCAVDCPVCINGTTQNCGSNVGECQQGTKTCVSGAWSPICAGEITPKAEICGNGLDEDCDGTSDEGCVDVIDPIVTSFSVSFNSATNISTASFSVTDNVNLNKVELWVAPDNLGVPGVWVNVSQSNISGLSYTGTLSDTPSSGIFWYGLHVIDASANMGSEPNPPGPIWINKVVTLSGAHGIVFYKTSTTIGNVGGRSGADSFCQSNKPSELTCNNIHAFISTNASDEIRDMPTNYTYPIDAELYWYNKNTNNFTLFASNWADMLDGSILASPATGLGVFAGNFWTGSQNDGSITPDAAAVGSCTGLFWSYQCNNWTFNGTGNCTVGNPYFGTQGNSNSVNNWIRNTSNFSMCSDDKYVLCNCADTSVCINGTTQNCGSNVGECQQGTQTCVSGAWSPICAGEITPEAEICGNGLDEDCDGVADNGCVCVENWTCTPFSACVGGTQSRICTDNNNCGTTLNKPIENQLCLQVEIKRPDDGYDVAGGGVGGVSFEALVLGGTPPYTFNWNSNLEGDFSTNQWSSVDVSSWTLGDHQVTLTVTDSASNVVTDTETFKISDFIIANMGPHNGQNMEEMFTVWFSASVDGGTAPFSYLWKSDKAGVLNASGPKIDNWDSFQKDDLSLGVHAITLTVTDSNNASVSKTNYLQIIPFVPIDVVINSPANNSTFQQGDDVSFVSNVLKWGVWPHTFKWSSSLDGDISTEKNFNVNNLSVGSHFITMTTIDAKGNTGSASINLTITSPSPVLPVINSPAPNSVFKRIDEVVALFGSATGGVVPYNYSWNSNIDGALGTGDKLFKNDLSVGSHVITFTVKDAVNATVNTSVNITINGGCAISNTKNNAQYSAKEVFFIADENWRDVLAMVPVTTWKDGNTIHAYPSLIYHKEVGNFDVDSSIHFMQQYEPDHLTTVGTTLAAINNLLVASKPVGAGMNAVNINNINASDYFSYWTGYNTLVVVDYNDYKSGLIASVLASEHNSPIIFVNNSNLASYQGIINGKTIYTVGTLDGPTQAYINNNASCQVDYTIEELQKWYSGTSNSNKLILVNPNDLTIKYSQSYTTEKGTAIADMYTKMSLAAPFLAAAKEEVITFSDLGDSGTNTSCSASAVITANAAQADTDAAYAINNFFVNPPDFLTIIATPRALPDSVYDDQCTGSWQHRAPRDWVYGSLDNVDVQINTGRIYGISVADASAHIARSINYDYLRNKIYGANWSSVSVGHSFAYCSNYSKEIRDKLTASGYNASCYTEDSLANCTQSKNPPYSVYKNKNYISFADHGSPYAWYQTMDYNNIPWLDMTVSIGTACLTNDYWQYTNRNFGAHMIRRGALGYVGAVGIAWTSSGNIITNGIKYLGEDANLTTGEMFLKLRVAGNCWDNDYILMGDPTLQPKFKAVTW